MKKIGILGGMGPEASADLYLKLIKLFYTRAGENMKSYPHIFINNIPIPNLFQQTGQNVGYYLGQEAYKLEQVGSEILAIACNSAHFYLNDIRHAVSHAVIVIDMIAEVAKKVREDECINVGVLSTLKSRPLYLTALKAQSLKPVLPEDSQQEHVENIISKILSGQKTLELKNSLKTLAEVLINFGADCVVLGCTDLPLLLKEHDCPFPLYSSTDVLANVIFEYATEDISPGK